jgi:hypothetical protein
VTFLDSQVDYTIDSIKDKLQKEKVKHLSKKNIYAKSIISEKILTLLSTIEDSNQLRSGFPAYQTARQNHTGLALQPFRISLRRKQTICITLSLFDSLRNKTMFQSKQSKKASST